jgi:hypothetical protein
MFYRLERKIYATSAVLGIWYNSHNKELCRTLENSWIRNIPKISCIPEGKYKCKKFIGNKYKNVWILEGIEGRSYILIHNGNLEKHTQGCILVGSNWGFLKDELAVLNSRKTLEKLRSILPDKFELEITRKDY